jgi:hypothetical protein
MSVRTINGVVCLLACASLMDAPALACEVPGRQAGQTASGSGAQGASQSSAVAAVQNQTLSQAQNGMPAGPGAAFPTGQFRDTWHDAYSAAASPWPGYKSQTSEKSAMASGYYRFQQTVFGGSLQAGVFGGENWVNTTFKPASALSGNLSGTKQSNLSSVIGGYVLYAFGANYVMNTAATFHGRMAQKGWGFTQGSYGTSGFADTAVAGHVFELNAGATPFNVDLRGGILYSNASGGGFTNSNGEVFRPSSDNWTASVSATLYRDWALSSGVTVRPYVKAGLKEQISYSNKVTDTYHGATTTYNFHEDGALGDAEAGFDYTISSVTITGAVYAEAGADQTSLGGRLGAKIGF